MIQIYGSPASSARRSYWVLEELGLEYEQVPLKMKEKQHKSEEFLKLNPNGKIPCLIDGDFLLWESMAINQYLVEKYSPEFLGNSPEEKGLIYQWSYWSILDAQPPLIDIFIQENFVPAEKKNLELIEKSNEKLKPLYKVLDDHLEGREYFVADRFTLADLHVGSVIDVALTLKVDFSTYPNLQKWAEKVTARPAYQKVLSLGKGIT